MGHKYDILQTYNTYAGYTRKRDVTYFESIFKVTTVLLTDVLLLMFMYKSHLAHTDTGTGNDATRLKKETLMKTL
jgi:hypothetical protein